MRPPPPDDFIRSTHGDEGRDGAGEAALAEVKEDHRLRLLRVEHALGALEHAVPEGRAALRGMHDPQIPNRTVKV